MKIFSLKIFLLCFISHEIFLPVNSDNNSWYVMHCAIWYHLYNLKNAKNTHGEVLILVKLQAVAYSFTKLNSPPWVLFTLLKLYKWYQIAQRTTY